MKLKLNKRKNIIHVVDDNLTSLGDYFFKKIDNIKTIRMFKIKSFGLFVFYNIRYKHEINRLFAGIYTTSQGLISKSDIMYYGIYYGYSMYEYIN